MHDHKEEEATSAITFDEIQRVFNQIDVNNDGSLSHEELRDAFTAVPGIEKQKIEGLIEKIDKDGSGEVDLEELVETCMFDSTVEHSQMLMKLIVHQAETFKNDQETEEEVEHISIQERSPLRVSEKTLNVAMTPGDFNLKKVFTEDSPNVQVSNLHIDSFLKSAKDNNTTCGDHHHEIKEVVVKQTICNTILRKIKDWTEQVMSLVQFSRGAQLRCTTEDKMDVFEPENDNRSYTRHFKVVFLSFVVFCLILSVVLSSVSKIGTQKSQSSEFSNPAQITFKSQDLNNLVYVKFFANISTQEIQKNMDCYVNNNTQVCRNLGAKKCDLKYRQSQSQNPSNEFYEYRACIRSVYSQYYGPNSLEYCRFEFGNSSGIHEEEERNQRNLADIDSDPKSLMAKMYNCYKRSSSIKQFCEDIKTGDEMLLKCFQQLKVESNILQEDIDKLEAKISCKTDSESGDQYYECLNKSKDTINFCYDQYMIDFNRKDKTDQSTDIDTKVEECIDNSIDDKFDHIMSKFKHSIANNPDSAQHEFHFNHGVTAVDFYKSSDYFDMLFQINKKYPLQGSLKCSLLLAKYFQMPQSEASTIAMANMTLNAAFDCFIEEDFPFYEVGCKLKYQMDKNLPRVRDEQYYLSNCISGTMNYYYPQDQQIYAVKQYNIMLEKYESQNSVTPYFAFNELNDYCTRRFTNSEELLNCRVITGSIKEVFSTDFCSNRIFTEDSKFFNYNLVYKYKCLRDRMGPIQSIEPVLEEQLLVCLDDKNPSIVQQKCLEERQSKLIYVTPFDKISTPTIVYLNNSDDYQYHLMLKELDNYVLVNFNESQIKNFTCSNTKSLVQLATTLKMPEHLTTIMGQKYKRVIKFDGWFSLHFDPEGPYIDHSKTPESWISEDGTHLQKMMFSNWTYDAETRHFEGYIVFDSLYFGLTKYYYNLTFTDDFLEISDGMRTGYNKDGVITDTETHHTGGLVAYEYIISHETNPLKFELDCQSLREKSYYQNIDNVILYYALKNDPHEGEEENHDIKLIRLQNETSFDFSMSDKMVFTHVNSISMFQSTDQDSESFDDVSDLNIGVVKNYLKKSSYNQIFGGEEQDVGTSEFSEIRLRVKVDKKVHQNFIPDESKMVMGFPLAFLHFTEYTIGIQKLQTNFVTKPVANGFSYQDQYSVYVGFDFDFTVQSYIYEYFSTVDIISQLGGIGATIKIILAMLGPLVILQFMYEFSHIILRQANQKIRVFRIKDILKQRQNLIEKIKEHIISLKDEEQKKECENELQILSCTSREIKQAKRIISQSKTKSIVPVDLDGTDDPENIGIPSYSETQELLDKFESIRQKYLPDADTYATKTLNQRIHFYMTNDRFYEQERIEVRKKYNYYKMRIQMPFFELISMAQYRLSLYNIFNITDHMEINTLKTKKVRNQLKLVKIRLDENHLNDHKTLEKLKNLEEEVKLMQQKLKEEEPQSSFSGLKFESLDMSNEDSKVVKLPNIFSKNLNAMDEDRSGKQRFSNKKKLKSPDSQVKDVMNVTAGIRKLIKED